MTKKIFLTGIVQGVGFRPCCKKVADQMQLSGTVKNLGSNAEIVIRSDNRVTEEFLRRLVCLLPETARIDSVSIEDTDEFFGEGFSICLSSISKELLPEILPDIATCENCIKELNDQNNRRYRHPFISCTVCGPRYSIISSIPYDRKNTLMGKFALCNRCKSEYTEPDDRRLHAQTIACKECGPKLMWSKGGFSDPLLSAVSCVKRGGVIAVKDIGGFHFVCLPDCKEAVDRLRLLKQRDKKPFAVMFPNIDSIKKYCEINDAEEGLLVSSARPIVLLKKVKDFYSGVCSDSRYIGAMLPSNPVQTMLLSSLGPLVMTSGNISGEPIITDNKTMLNLAEENSELDGVLYHDRDIITPLDDSIYYVIDGTAHIMRRGRGVAPLSVPINAGDKTIFAAGGDLKSSFGFYKNGKAVLSQHLGDLEDEGCAKEFEKCALHMADLFDFKPEISVLDMHPAYFSGSLARKLYPKTAIKIQHHHAHIASVMAEHGLDECLGFAFDGTGMGDDGTIWGGEALVCKGAEYTRIAHLKTVDMAGGDETAKNAGACLTFYCAKGGIRPPVHSIKPSDAAILSAAVKTGIGKFGYSGAGRLFDAVCSLLGFGNYNYYEGQCAIALENAADFAISQGAVAYPLELDYNNGVLDTVKLVCEIAKAKERGIGVYSLALGFHYALAEGIVKVAKEANIKKIALSGGTFNNRILTMYLKKRLGALGFEVYLNEKVPCGDGGIALGQLYLASKVVKED